MCRKWNKTFPDLQNVCHVGWSPDKVCEELSLFFSRSVRVDWAMQPTRHTHHRTERKKLKKMDWSCKTLYRESCQKRATGRNTGATWSGKKGNGERVRRVRQINAQCVMFKCFSHLKKKDFYTERPWFEPITFVLWGDHVNHCTTVPPCCHGIIVLHHLHHLHWLWHDHWRSLL